MLTNIVIKAEPLDIEETKLMETHFGNSIEGEFDDVIGKSCESNLDILEEKPNLIVVKAGDDYNCGNFIEIEFLQEQQNNINTYSLDKNYMDLLRNNHSGQRCSVCFVTFSDVTLLLKHLNYHRENYFFCKHKNCGVSFKCLYECQIHEKTEHQHKRCHNKLGESFSKSTCSFCRNRFNSELQLHVHWLNKGDACGKLMQQIIEQYNDVLSVNVNNNPTNVQLATLPTTKLRLKAPVERKTEYSKSSKRTHEATDNNTVGAKNMKLNNDLIKPLIIKQEPLDIVDGDNDMMEENVLLDNMIPEIIMESDANCNDIENAESLNDDLNKMPENKLQNISPTDGSTKFNKNQLLYSGIDEVKLLPNVTIEKLHTNSLNGKSSQISSSLCQSVLSIKNNSNFNVNNETGVQLLPSGRNDLQIIKLPPNTLLMKMPVNQRQILSGNNAIEVRTDLTPISTLVPIENKSNTADIDYNNLQNVKTKSLPLTCTKSILHTQERKKVTLQTTSVPTSRPVPTPSLISTSHMAMGNTSNNHNTGIGNDVRNRNTISKESSKAIENLPENNQIFKGLIEESEKSDCSEMRKLENFNGVQSNNHIKAQPSYYVSLFSTTDLDVAQARHTHKDYRYGFLCPYCKELYEIKPNLRLHLLDVHNVSFKDLNKIYVEVKAFPDSNNTYNNDNGNKLKVFNDNYHKIQFNAASNLSMETRYFRCNKCGQLCLSEAKFDENIFTNCGREQCYTCAMCSKQFSSNSTLQCHMTIHTGELPHKCSYCEKRFRTRGQVTVHHRTHTGEKPFVCQVCALRFTHRETLIAHLSRHIGMKRFKCYGCDMNFSCISALKAHRGIRPHTCGKVKFNPRAVGPRVRVIRGKVTFEAQPEINSLIHPDDPKDILAA